MLSNPAFLLLREHKEVRHEVESMILKQYKYKLSAEEMIQCFEYGISGRYGKFISADVQTISSWINRFLAERTKGDNYLAAPLMKKDATGKSNQYPNNIELWHKEINKAYNAYLRGLSYSEFHHELQYFLVVDGKIKVGDIDDFLSKDYLQRFDPMNGPNEEIKTAHRKSLVRYFDKLKTQGFTYVYYIRQNEDI